MMEWEVLNKGFRENRDLCLALLVLGGHITEYQLNKLINTNEKLPDTWQGIIKRIKELQN